jgi:hypothetical protein
MIKPFPPLPPNWNVSRVAEDHFRIDDRYKGHLFSGSQDQCEAFITQQPREVGTIINDKQQAFIGDLVSFKGDDGAQCYGIVGWVDTKAHLATVLSHNDYGTLPLSELRLELAQEDLIRAGQQYTQQYAMDDQRDLYQVRDGNTATVLGVYPTINDANEVAWSIENGAPYAGVPASELAVEFWRRQPEGTYKQMTPEQVGRDLEAGPPEQPREPVAPHQQYRALLEQISDLRYPNADPALRRKIEVSIDKKVADFMAERGTLKTRVREQQQQMPPPAMRQRERGIGGYER